MVEQSTHFSPALTVRTKQGHHYSTESQPDVRYFSYSEDKLLWCDLNFSSPNTAQYTLAFSLGCHGLLPSHNDAVKVAADGGKWGKIYESSAPFSILTFHTFSRLLCQFFRQYLTCECKQLDVYYYPSVNLYFIFWLCMLLCCQIFARRS